MEAMEPVERLVWDWVLMNEMGLDAVEGSSQAQVVKYDELCADPLRVTRRVFEAVGLCWNPQTEAFLASSTTKSRGNETYHQIFRDPAQASNKWRKELTGEEIDTIESITTTSTPGRLFGCVATS